MIKVDLNVDLRKIPSLTFPELKEYYEALFNIPTTSTRKEYYVWRITNKLQEMRFGGLDNKTRRMLENMEIKELSEHKMVAGIDFTLAGNYPYDFERPSTAEINLQKMLRTKNSWTFYLKLKYFCGIIGRKNVVHIFVVDIFAEKVLFFRYTGK